MEIITKRIGDMIIRLDITPLVITMQNERVIPPIISDETKKKGEKIGLTFIDQDIAENEIMTREYYEDIDILEINGLSTDCEKYELYCELCKCDFPYADSIIDCTYRICQYCRLRLCESCVEKANCNLQQRSHVCYIKNYNDVEETLLNSTDPFSGLMYDYGSMLDYYPLFHDEFRQMLFQNVNPKSPHYQKFAISVVDNDDHDYFFIVPDNCMMTNTMTLDNVIDDITKCFHEQQILNKSRQHNDFELFALSTYINYKFIN